MAYWLLDRFEWSSEVARFETLSRLGEMMVGSSWKLGQFLKYLGMSDSRIWCGILICVLSGCGSGQLPVVQPATSVLGVTQAFEPLIYIAEQTLGVGTIDLQLARQSEAYRLFLDWAQSLVAEQSAAGYSDTMPHRMLALSQADRLTAALLPSGHDALLIVEGGFALSDMSHIFHSRDGPQPAEVTIGSFRALQSGGTLLAELTPSRFIWGPAEAVRAAIALPREASLAESAVYRATRAALPPAAYATAAVLRTDDGRQLRFAHQVDYRWAAFALAGGSFLRVAVHFLTNGPSAASPAAEAMRGMLAVFTEKQAPIIEAAGLSAAVGRIEFHHGRSTEFPRNGESSVLVRADLQLGELQSLLRFVHGWLTVEEPVRIEPQP